jgi:hypothetical protein
MASKFNSEFNYRYQVIGETIWEKIKTLKGFLEGRIAAGAMEEVSKLRCEAKLVEYEHLKLSNALPHILLNFKADLLEIQAHEAIQKDAMDLNREEIKMLKDLLAECLAIAEPTRIEGYSDEEMFEANAMNEFTVLLAREIQSEIIANGRPSPAKIKNAMLCPQIFRRLQVAGLIPTEIRLIAPDDPILQLNVADAELTKLLETVIPKAIESKI